MVVLDGAAVRPVWLPDGVPAHTGRGTPLCCGVASTVVAATLRCCYASMSPTFSLWCTSSPLVCLPVLPACRSVIRDSRTVSESHYLIYKRYFGE